MKINFTFPWIKIRKDHVHINFSSMIFYSKDFEYDRDKEYEKEHTLIIKLLGIGISVYW